MTEVATKSWLSNTSEFWNNSFSMKQKNKEIEIKFHQHILMLYDIHNISNYDDPFKEDVVHHK